jgi:excisionase family DNA binding protein
MSMARSRPVTAPIAVTVSHAAELLDCSRQHIYNLCERGTLRRARLAGSTAVRIPVVDLYAVLGIEAPDDAA